jgi:hypothetical protein
LAHRRCNVAAHADDRARSVEVRTCARKIDFLICNARRIANVAREVTARLLVHLGEVDARGLFRDLGFSSMFDYAVQALHMSEAEAWLRIRAARFGREFPTALAMVARGELNMTALKLLAPVLTPANIELLDQARFKSKPEIQTLIAVHFPQPDVPSTIRKLPMPKLAASVPPSTSMPALAPAPASASARGRAGRDSTIAFDAHDYGTGA